jgi:lysozyme
MRIKRLLLVLAVLGVLAAALVPQLYGRIEPALLWHDVIGIDVSNHQADIDWASLASDGVAFAYIKATEGGDFRDRRFQRNWDAAKAAGILRGAYHFFTQCKPGAEQAANFIRTVPKEQGALPPVVDAEHMGQCKSGPALPDVRGELLAFMALVEAHFGKRPIVYVTGEFHRAYLDGHMAAERFWVRSLFWPPPIRRESWLFWQFHNKAQRQSISGPVDLNAFRGSKAELDALAR